MEPPQRYISKLQGKLQNIYSTQHLHMRATADDHSWKQLSKVGVPEIFKKREK